MPCFLKMPALVPSWAIEVSQLPRWPIVSLTTSSAWAGRAQPSGASDVVNALMGLGYNEKEALQAVKGLPPGLGVAEGIRAALKALAKS